MKTVEAMLFTMGTMPSRTAARMPESAWLMMSWAAVKMESSCTTSFRCSTTAYSFSMRTTHAPSAASLRARRAAGR